MISDKYAVLNYWEMEFCDDGGTIDTEFAKRNSLIVPIYAMLADLKEHLGLDCRKFNYSLLFGVLTARTPATAKLRFKVLKNKLWNIT